MKSLTGTIDRVFKIRDKATGLFSRGGTNINNLWTKEGKSWSNIGHLKNHLNQFASNRNSTDPYTNAEILEVEINYDTCMKMDVSEIFDEMKLNKSQLEEKSRLRFKKWLEERERKQLEQLKKKYES